MMTALAYATAADPGRDEIADIAAACRGLTAEARALVRGMVLGLQMSAPPPPDAGDQKEDGRG